MFLIHIQILCTTLYRIYPSLTLEFPLYYGDSEILALGFDEKFIRTWEYYFDYCAAGFKSHALWDYQVHQTKLVPLYV